MKTLDDLRPLILDWAKAKDLLRFEIRDKQRLKLIEECGELASSVLKNDFEGQKDAIGDIFVVLVILAKQVGRELPYFSFDKESKRVDKMICFIIQSSLSYSFHFTLYYLENLAYSLGLDLTECANLAWDEIKDRTGKTIDGTFIKN